MKRKKDTKTTKLEKVANHKRSVEATTSDTNNVLMVYHPMFVSREQSFLIQRLRTLYSTNLLQKH